MSTCRDYPPLYKPVNTWDVLNDATRWQPLVLQPANSPNALGAPYIQTHITPQVRPNRWGCDLWPKCRASCLGQLSLGEYMQVVCAMHLAL